MLASRCHSTSLATPDWWYACRRACARGRWAALVAGCRRLAAWRSRRCTRPQRPAARRVASARRDEGPLAWGSILSGRLTARPRRAVLIELLPFGDERIHDVAAGRRCDRALQRRLHAGDRFGEEIAGHAGVGEVDAGTGRAEAVGQCEPLLVRREQEVAEELCRGSLLCRSTAQDREGVVAQQCWIGIVQLERMALRRARVEIDERQVLVGGHNVEACGAE